MLDQSAGQGRFADAGRTRQDYGETARRGPRRPQQAEGLLPFRRRFQFSKRPREGGLAPRPQDFNRISMGVQAAAS